MWGGGGGGAGSHWPSLGRCLPPLEIYNQGMLYRFAPLIISEFQFCPPLNKILNAALHVSIRNTRYFIVVFYPRSQNLNVVHRSGYKTQQRMPKLVIHGSPPLFLVCCVFWPLYTPDTQYTYNEVRPPHLLESSIPFIFYKRYKHLQYVLIYRNLLSLYVAF